jgi:hypothetical protein
MPLNEDTEALLLAYVYGELSASDARDFERRMDAGTPEAAELRAEVESMRASRELFGKDAAFGLRTGIDVPPAHLVDAIMNAEKLARTAVVRDAALARSAPPVEKSLTAKLSRWLLGGGVALGAAAALFIVVSRPSAEEPSVALDVIDARQMNEFRDGKVASKTEESAGAGVASAAAPAAEKPVEAPPPAEPDAPFGGADDLGGLAGARLGATADATVDGEAGEKANRGFADRLADAERNPEVEEAPAQDPAVAMNRAARGRSDDAKQAAPKEEASKEAFKEVSQEAAKAKDAPKSEKLAAKLDANDEQDVRAKAKAKEVATESARESSKSAKTRDAPRAEPRSGDSYAFDSVVEKRAESAESKKADQGSAKGSAKGSTVRELEKAGMRSSAGADKDIRGGGGAGAGIGNLGIATGAASSGPGSAPGSAPTTTAVPTTPPADAPSRAMSPPPPPPAATAAPAKKPVIADAKPAPKPSATSDEADDEMSMPPKVISREALEEQRKNVKKKSGGATGKGFMQDAERARRLEQANIALASAQREMAAKRWMGAFDQMVLAESLDPDRALGATPLVGQMRALVELRRPVDAARVARRLGRWDVKAYDVVPGLLLGAQVAEQIGDERLARELWTRLLDVPAERAKAQAALARMEGAKALRRQQYDSDAAEAPAAAAPAEAESARE